MSGISSATSDYNQYKQAIQDLESDHEVDKKRVREKDEKHVDALHDKYESTLKENDQETEKALETQRERYQEALKSQKDYFRSELDDQKNKTYDKFGRFGGLEGDEANRQLKALKEQNQAQAEDFNRKIQDQDDSAARRIRALGESSAMKTEQAVKYQKDSLGDGVSDAIAREKEVSKLHRESIEKTYRDLEKDKLSEQMQLRKNAESIATGLNNEREHMIMQTDDSNAHRLQGQNEAHASDVEKKTLLMNRSAANEARLMQSQLDNVRTHNDTYGRGKAEGKADAVREYDADVRSEIWSMKDRYGRELENFKEHSKEAEGHYNRLNNKNLMEKDLQFAKTIASQNNEHHQRESDVRLGYQKESDQVKALNRKEKEYHGLLLEKQVIESARQKDNALATQARTFKEDFARSNTEQGGQIDLLQREIQRQRTSDDPNDIPPAAEAHMKAKLMDAHSKMLQTDDDRTKEAIGSVQEEYSRRMKDTVLDAQYKTTAVEQMNALRSHADRVEFLQHVHDIEASKVQALTEQDAQFQKQAEKSNRSFSTTLEDQRKQYEGILQAVKMDASEKIRGQQLDNNFKYTMAVREMASKHNEVVRQYEKQMADLREDYGMQLRELKKMTDAQIRDSEKQTKRELEDQLRSFEQRTAQTEVQYKERERFLTETYEDKIERVRRQSALNAKKS